MHIIIDIDKFIATRTAIAHENRDKCINLNMRGCIFIWRTDKKRSRGKKSARDSKRMEGRPEKEREKETERKREIERESIAEGGSWRDAGATRANHSAVSLDRERRWRRIDNRFAFVWLTIKFSYELGGRWTASDGCPLSPSHPSRSQLPL